MCTNIHTYIYIYVCVYMQTELFTCLCICLRRISQIYWQVVWYSWIFRSSRKPRLPYSLPKSSYKACRALAWPSLSYSLCVDVDVQIELYVRFMREHTLPYDCVCSAGSRTLRPIECVRAKWDPIKTNSHHKAPYVYVCIYIYVHIYICKYLSIYKNEYLYVYIYIQENLAVLGRRGYAQHAVLTLPAPANSRGAAGRRSAIICPLSAGLVPPS